ncbi:MAG: SRPBCC domain-containing protein [Leptospiraceae bacterium]|nr:SRPBCC domain-containing protein [Leptospiraceae bacterium]
MNEIHTEIEINAPKEVIWKILTDFSAYPEWNPFIVNITGTPRLGATILFVARFEAISIPILANIIQFEKEKSFSWGGPGISWLKSVFTAEHFFIIEEIENGKCRFTNKEQMDGAIPDALWLLIERGKPAYEAMNEALKKRAEADNRN